MGGKQSTESAVNGRSTSRHTGAVANGVGEHSRVVSLDPRIRTRSLNSVDHSFPIPSHQSAFQDSGLTSNDDNSTQLRGLYTIQGAHSLPAQLFATSFITGVKCPVCSKVVISEDIELHLVVCLTKPRLSYNEDILQCNSEECAICLDDMRKEKTSEKLQCPSKSQRPDFGVGYSRMAENLEGFFSLDAMPFSITQSQLNDGSGIYSTLLNKKASWHITCKDKINSTKLERARKRKQSKVQSENDNCSPIKKTRQSTGSLFKEKKQVKCFFCNGDPDSSGFHKATSLEFDENVRICAEQINRTDLLAKLSGTDMVAIDAVYHKSCLTSFYNEARLSEEKNEKEGSKSRSSLQALALASLVSYIEEFRDSEVLTVFKLAELLKLYDRKLQELGMPDYNVRSNSTRLKERLLSYVPGLRAFSQGKNVLLTFDNVVGEAIHKVTEQNYDNEALEMARVAKRLRQDLEKCNQSFEGSFSSGCQEKSVPISLVTLLEMIIQGSSSIKGDDGVSQDKEVRPAILTTAQLILFNMTKRSHYKGKRHSTSRESPVAIYIALKIHGETRNKGLIDALYTLGLCISYNRLLEISTDMANAVLARFENDGVVCPLKLMMNLFTTSAIDNLDHNPSCTTATDAFHGTAISLAQHPTIDQPGIERPTAEVMSNQRERVIGDLPESYRCVHPAILREPNPTASSLSHLSLKLPESISECFSPDEKEMRWLNEVKEKATNNNNLQKNEYISWGAFHATQQAEATHKPAIVSLLPLFLEEAHSVSMIIHGMNVIKKAVDFINEGQQPVIALDQPLYAISKQIQWNWPSTYGEDKFVIMLGALHIEMAAFKVLGDWLDGSGWTGALETAGVATSGVADSFIKASHLTRTRRAHQITASSLFILQKKAYGIYLEKIDPGTDPLTFDSWVEESSKSHPQFLYWNKVLSLELCVLQLVRSIREANFDLYKSSIALLIPWMFAMDHTNYARWLSVHLRDLRALPSLLPDINKEFQKGSFVVHKSTNPFSAIALDQAHEQENAVVKGDGGAVGLTSNPAALKRWMVAGPEVARVIKEFESSTSSLGAEKDKKGRQHEQYPAFQESFKKDIIALVEAFEELGNPFEEESTDLISLESKEIMTANVINSVKTAHSIGVKKCKAFLKERFEDKPKPITEPIAKNKLPMLKSKPEKKTTKAKEKLVSLKNDCALFSRLYIGCQSRPNGNLEEFFKHENQPFPPSLAEAGNLRSGKKADLAKCLEDLDERRLEPPDVDVEIIDGAVIVQMLKPGIVHTFKEYADMVFIPYILKRLEFVKRLDVIWDVYVEDSLKTSTRERRGTGTRIRVGPSSKIPKNWQGFLRVNDNKTDLFLFLAKELEALNIEDKVIYSTYGEDVLSSSPVDTSSLQCTHEEADTRIMVHALNAANSGHAKLLIRTIDTDVLVLAVSKQQDLTSEETWIAFGTGKHFRYIAVHKIAEKLGIDRSRALPMFHALTGCDTVSYFARRGKIQAWDLWRAFPEITTTFSALSSVTTSTIPLDLFSVIERFVVLLYCRTSSQVKVNAARKDLFTKGNRSIENIPPTQAALLQHLRRAVYQGGLIWGSCLVQKPTLPSPSEWGWQKVNETWTPVWTELAQAQDTCYELIHCGCKKGCRGRCKCVKANLVCTALCHCGGECDRE